MDDGPRQQNIGGPGPPGMTPLFLPQLGPLEISPFSPIKTHGVSWAFPKFKVLLLSQSVNGQLFNSKNKGDCQLWSRCGPLWLRYCPLWSVVVISHTAVTAGNSVDTVRVVILDKLSAGISG